MSRPLGPLVTRFLADLKGRGYSPRTIEEYRHALARLLEHLADHGIEKASEVTSASLVAYQARLAAQGGLHGRPLTQGAQANVIGQIRTLFKFLVRTGQLLTNPASELEMPRCVRRVPDRVLDLSSMKRLLLVPDVRTARGLRDRGMLELLYSTGLRVSELIGLDVFEIDLAEGELLVRRGKGGKNRRVPVGEAAVIWVGRYLKDARPQLAVRRGEPALFLSKRGRRLDRANVAKIVRTHAKAAGIEKRVTPHTMRHTFATHMLRGKASLRHLQELLGHLRLETTQVYTKVDISDLKEVHRRCHPRGRG
jgi:integrase/recombinase XerD